MSILTIFTVITRAVGFVFKVYLSNMLSTEELGIYTITISIYMLLLTFVTGNISTTISKNISQNVNNKTYKYEFVTNSILLSIVTAILLCGFVIIFKPLFLLLLTNDASYELLLYLLPSIICMALYSPIMGYFWGKNNYFYVSIIEFIEQVIRIVLSVIFIWFNVFNNYMISACLGLTIACVISSFIGYILYFTNKAKLHFTFIHTKTIASSTIPLTLMRLVGSSIQPIINIVVPIALISVGYSNSQSIELIGIIFGMCMPILTIPATIIGSINMAILPDISYHSSKHQILNNKIRSNFKFILICSFIMLPIFIVLADPICTILYSNITIGHYLCYSSWLIIPMGVYQYYSSIMNALGKEKQNFVYSTISSAIMIIFILTLTPYFKIYALILGLGINYILSSTMCLHSIKKTTHYNHNVLSDIILNLLIITPITILVYLIYNIIGLVLLPIYNIIIISIISIISYCTLIVIFEYIDIKYICRFVKG